MQAEDLSSNARIDRIIVARSQIVVLELVKAPHGVTVSLDSSILGFESYTAHFQVEVDDQLFWQFPVCELEEKPCRV